MEPTNDTAATSNNSSANATINYTWTSIPDGPYKAQLLRNGAWVDITMASTSATGLSFTAASLYAANGNTAGTNLTVRVLDSYSTRVAQGTVSFSRTTFFTTYYTVSANTLSDLQ